jgi:hypothetical protein
MSPLKSKEKDVVGTRIAAIYFQYNITNWSTLVFGGFSRPKKILLT